MKSKIFLFFVMISVALITACDEPKQKELGNIYLKFEFNVDGEKVVLDELKYENKAGNQYMINDIQMIISKIKLIKSDNSEVVFNTDVFVHYFDYAYPGSLLWKLPKKYDGGIYKNIGFTLGLDETMNTSGRFTNPPISDMFWPEVLGGGYHYMKLNCKWTDNEAKEAYSHLNFHLGRVPVYEAFMDADSITDPIGYMDNHFEIQKEINFEIKENDITFIVSINLNNWFNSPNVIDFSTYRDVSIMQNSTIQVLAKQNGANVFDIELQKQDSTNVRRL